MSTDPAALAATVAAARELHLPTVRAEAAKLAEIAVRERQTIRRPAKRTGTTRTRGSATMP